MLVCEYMRQTIFSVSSLTGVEVFWRMEVAYGTAGVTHTSVVERSLTVISLRVSKLVYANVRYIL